MFINQLCFSNTDNNSDKNHSHNDSYLSYNSNITSHSFMKNIDFEYENMLFSSFSNQNQKQNDADPYNETYEVSIKNPDFNEIISKTINLAVPLVYNNKKNQEKTKKNQKKAKEINFVLNYNIRKKIISKHFPINKSKSIKNQSHVNKDSKNKSNFDLREYKGGLFDGKIKKNEIFIYKTERKINNIQGKSNKSHINNKNLNEKERNNKEKKEENLNLVSNINKYGNGNMKFIDNTNRIFILESNLKKEKSLRKDIVKSLYINKSKSHTKQHKTNHINSTSKKQENFPNKLNDYKFNVLLNQLTDSLMDEIIDNEVGQLNNIENSIDVFNSQRKIYSMIKSYGVFDLIENLREEETRLYSNKTNKNHKDYSKYHGNNHKTYIKKTKFKSELPSNLVNNIKNYKEIYNEYQKVNGVFFTKNIFELYSKATKEISIEMINNQVDLCINNHIDSLVVELVCEETLKISNLKYN